MSSEKPDFMALDAYIRSQLTAAAETYASRSDIDARLQATLASGKDTADTTPADCERFSTVAEANK